MELEFSLEECQAFIFAEKLQLDLSGVSMSFHPSLSLSISCVQSFCISNFDTLYPPCGINCIALPKSCSKREYCNHFET